MNALGIQNHQVLKRARREAASAARLASRRCRLPVQGGATPWPWPGRPVAGIESKNSLERITALQQQLDEERDRADLAVQAVAKAEVRLELIPGLQAEVERLKPFEQRAAVLTANLEASRSVSNDLQGRLAEALADAKAAHADLEKSRGAEQSLQAKLDAAMHEIQGLQTALSEVKHDLAEARQDVKDARVEAKEARAEAARVQQPKKD